MNFHFLDVGCLLKLKAYTRVFECDPSSLAFPSQNNELTQPSHTQQYPSVCTSARRKGTSVPELAMLKTEIHDISKPQEKADGRFQCGTFLVEYKCASICTKVTIQPISHSLYNQQEPICDQF